MLRSWFFRSKHFGALYFGKSVASISVASSTFGGAGGINPKYISPWEEIRNARSKQSKSSRDLLAKVGPKPSLVEIERAKRAADASAATVAEIAARANEAARIAAEFAAETKRLRKYREDDDDLAVMLLASFGESIAPDVSDDGTWNEVPIEGDRADDALAIMLMASM